MKSTAILDIKQFERFENQQELYVRIFSEHLQNHHHAISVPHKHNFYVTILFTQGSGFHEIDFERFDVQRGSIFLLNPGQTHYWELSDDIEGIIFFHTESFYTVNFTQNSLSSFPFFYSTQNSPYLLLKAEMTPIFERHFELILEEYTAEKMYKSKKLICLIDLLYIELSRFYLNQNEVLTHKTSSYSVKLKQLELLIDQHFKKEKSPAQYANWMHMSTKHLNRITQLTVGKTTSQVISERVLLEAKRLLTHAESNVNEIAEYLGFEDQAYFSRLFKKFTATTPSEFKAKYLRTQH